MAKSKKANDDKNEPLEKQLWKAADKLRKNIDAAEYKHVVLGLMFLKYISDSFEEMFARLQAGEGNYAGADPEDKDEYKAKMFFSCQPKPAGLFWSAKQSTLTSAPTLTPLWMQSKKKTLRSRAFCPKFIRDRILTRLTLAA